MNSSNIFLMIFFGIFTFSNHAMLQYVRDCFNSSDRAIQHILSDRESMVSMAKTAGREGICYTVSNYNYSNIFYTIRVTKERDSDQIEAVITCNKPEILDKVNKLLLEKKCSD